MKVILNAAEMARMARQFDDVWDQDGSGQHPAAVDPDVLAWRHVPAFPVSQFDAPFGRTRDRAWVAFIASELPPNLREHGTEDEKLHYLAALREAVRQGTVEPILIVQGADAGFWPLDGFHRIGMAVREEIGTLPAYVGYQPGPAHQALKTTVCLSQGCQ